MTKVLGKKVSKYDFEYNPDLLYIIPRKKYNIHKENDYEIFGLDIWNAYEVSWLSKDGIPKVGIAIITYSSNSDNIVESKSLKLYLNSLNNSKFQGKKEVQDIISRDLMNKLKTKISVKIYDLNIPSSFHEIWKEKEFFQSENLILLDKIKIEHNKGFHYQNRLNFLRKKNVKSGFVRRNLYTNLFKSNCPVTGQPDWATIFICYEGEEIKNAALLSYLICFRNHQDFHEHCIETIYNEIMENYKLKSLLIYGRYTRRGGIDINPVRCSNNNLLKLMKQNGILTIRNVRQ